MDLREPDSFYESIAKELIRNNDSFQPIRDSDVRIAYLVSDREKKENGKTVFAQCEKIPDRYKWSVPYDFMITVFEPNVDGLSRDQLRVLMEHELMHVGIDDSGDGEKYRVVPHDVEDFRAVIEKYGLDWSEE